MLFKIKIKITIIIGYKIKNIIELSKSVVSDCSTRQLIRKKIMTR